MDLDRKEWQAALRLLAKVAPKRSPRAILSDVLLTQRGTDRLECVATDGEAHLSLRLATLDLPPGAFRCAVPLEALKRATAGKGGPVRLALAGEKLTADAATLLTDDAELYPACPIADIASPVTEWESGWLAAAIHRTVFACAQDMGRYAFNGLLIEAEAHGTAFVGTDGRRVAVERSALNGLPAGVSAIVPARVAALLETLASKSLGGIHVQAGAERWTWSGTLAGIAWSLTAYKLEGEFPDFRAVMPKPKDVPHEVRFCNRETLPALKQAATTAGEQDRAVDIKACARGALEIRSRHEGVGETRCEVATGLSCDGPSTRYNPEFLTEALSVLPEDSIIRWRFKGRADCATFEAVGVEGWTYALMPITC